MSYHSAAAGILGAICVAAAALPLHAWTPADPPNSPTGFARGIFPGRVAWVRNPAAAVWNGTAGHWWDDATGTDQAQADAMFAAALQSLSGASNAAAAWQQIFLQFNIGHGRGTNGYVPGELVAVKINCNNSTSYTDIDNQADASPQSVLALLRQLVLNAGVPQTNILVYDTGPSPRCIPNRIYAKGHAEFPDVSWMDAIGTNGRQLVSWRSTLAYSTNVSGCGVSIPLQVYNAVYLINMSLLKGHNTAGVSLTAKNHYGSINGRDHTLYVDARNHPMGSYHPFVDLIGARHLGGKTLFFMIDGLYGVRDVNDNVGTYGRWNNLFGGQWSASYFLSLDPVALDSVGLDFLRSEFTNSLGGSSATANNADNYLHEAALADAPPSHMRYQPNGVTLSSLGVHEHWNNSTGKQYSRNLGTGAGIELAPMLLPEPALLGLFSGMLAVVLRRQRALCVLQ